MLVFTSGTVRNSHPLATQALIAAIAEAIDFIHSNPRRAAEIYLESESSPLPVEQVEAVIRDPGNEYAVVPRNALIFARFQHRIGTLRHQPETWRELFFPEAPLGDGKGG